MGSPSIRFKIRRPAACGLHWRANTAGMGAFASEAALARIASTGGELSATAAWTLGTAKAMSNVTNAAAFSNASIDLVANWDR